MRYAIQSSPRAVLLAVPPLVVALPCFLTGQHLLIGALSLLLSAALGSSYDGIELDVFEQRYRHFTWVLGRHLGRWNALPPTTRVVIKPHSDYIETRGSSGSPSSRRYEHLTLLLSIPGSVIGEVLAEYPLSARSWALAVGQELADALQVPLLVLEGA